MAAMVIRLHKEFEDARRTLDNFNKIHENRLLPPGSQRYQECVELTDRLSQRFEELAALDVDNAHGAYLLQQAVLAQVGEMIRETDDNAYEALRTVADFLGTMSKDEK